MVNYTRKLPVKGPRNYTLRDAYRGRVWRSPAAVLAREMLGWSIAGILFGYLMEHALLFSVGAVGVIGSLVAMIIGSLLTNRRRVRIIKDGLPASATMLRPGRIFVLHELLRGEREKTFILKFQFTDQNGHDRQGRIWVCGCAKQYFPEFSQSPIVYDPLHPSKSLPLRLGVMVAPH